jgi:hypothetical protein
MGANSIQSRTQWHAWQDCASSLPTALRVATPGPKPHTADAGPADADR